MFLHENPMRLEEELRTTKFQDDIHKAQLNILFSAAWIRTRLLASVKPHGITIEQFNVLRIVRGKQPDGILIKDITRRMLERNSNTTRIIDRLEEKGLVERHFPRHDRRQRPIYLTPAGADLLASIDREWAEKNPHQANWTTEEARSVNVLLDKMREL